MKQVKPKANSKQAPVISVVVTITYEQLFNILVSALEGVNYWAGEFAPLKWVGKDGGPYNDDFYHSIIKHGLELEHRDPDTGRKKRVIKITPDRWTWALQAMADGKDGIPFRHFEAVISNNGDVETADVFLQFAALGKCPYG